MSVQWRILPVRSWLDCVSLAPSQSAIGPPRPRFQHSSKATSSNPYQNSMKSQFGLLLNICGLSLVSVVCDLITTHPSGWWISGGCCCEASIMRHISRFGPGLLGPKTWLADRGLPVECLYRDLPALTHSLHHCPSVAPLKTPSLASFTMLLLRGPLLGVVIFASIWLFVSLFWAYGSFDHVKARIVTSESLRLTNLFDVKNETLGVRHSFTHPRMWYHRVMLLLTISIVSANIRCIAT
jgi:hypothetical protein